MLAIAVIVLRRRSVVLTRSLWKVVVVGKYEHGKEVVVIRCRCLSLEGMEAVGREQAAGGRCAKARRQ